MRRPQSASPAAPGSPTAPAPAADSEPTPSPSGGRAERADKARNRARILSAASEAVAERGIDTQMDDVAARAGLGVGTLYRHFATKEALMLALVERRFQQILEVTRRGIERRDAEPFEVFASALREGAEVVAGDAGTQDAMTEAGDVVWEGVAPILSELDAANQVLIDRAQAAGTLRSDFSAADVPMIMCGVSSTMAVPRYDWRRYLELVLDGLRAEESDDRHVTGV